MYRSYKSDVRPLVVAARMAYKQAEGRCWGLFHVLKDVRIEQIPDHLFVGSSVTIRLLLEEFMTRPAQGYRNLHLLLLKR